MIDPPVTLSSAEFANCWGMSEVFQAEDGEVDVWGLAGILRREIDRRGAATTREINDVVVPVLATLGFETKSAKTQIRSLLEAMAAVSDVEELRGRSQVSWCRRLPECVVVSTSLGALLGSDPELDSIVLPPTNRGTQFVRQIDMADDTVRTQLDDLAVPVRQLRDWAGLPSWFDGSLGLTSVTELWQEYVRRLGDLGHPLSEDPVSVRVVRGQPGEYFGRVGPDCSGRWTRANDLPNGVFLAAQSGHSDSHWHPMLLEADQGKPTRAIFLDGWDSFYWLLLGRGRAQGEPECAIHDETLGELRFTCPLPQFYRRLLSLSAVPSAEGPWVWRLGNLRPEFWMLNFEPCCVIHTPDA